MGEIVMGGLGCGHTLLVIYSMKLFWKRHVEWFGTKMSSSRLN